MSRFKFRKTQCITAIEQRQIISELQNYMASANEIEREIESGLTRVNLMRQSILKSAFEGRLGLQDPNDEPASVLLQRVKTERTVTKGSKAEKRVNDSRQMRLPHVQ